MSMSMMNRLRALLTGLMLAACLGGCGGGGSLSVVQLMQEGEPRDAFRHAAVATDHPVASLAGLEMLRRGGNAVDAAVAASFCLSVVRPYSCGIGGGGFMVMHIPATRTEAAQHIALNYRETAPALVGPDYYTTLDDPHASRFGYHASGVPGNVAGLLYALDRWGTLDRQTVLAPAIRAAELGFIADENFISAGRSLMRTLERHPHLAEAASYLVETLYRDGKLQLGDRVFNPQQARALRLIAQHGEDAFYRGEIAQAIAALMDEHGGSLRFADLDRYTPRVSEPLIGSFRDMQVISMPPPSSGGVAMQQMLGLLERRSDAVALSSPSTHNSADYVHLLTETMKHAFADRAQWLADSRFVDVPVERLLSSAYLDELAARIDMTATRDAYAYGSVEPLGEDGGTSHLSVIDSNGMAVACTETINLSFGSLVVVPGFGFTLNNEMDDFTTIPGAPNAFGLRQSDRNLPEPGKRPLSSMSPTIVVRDGKAIWIGGASGGPRIITATLQVMLNNVLFDMTPARAVAEARFHHQWMPETLQFERHWGAADVIEAMHSRGHTTGEQADIGVVQVIHITPDGIRAASDPRKGGMPAGY